MTTTPETIPPLYMPASAQLVALSPKRMVALIGEGGTGKTHAAVTTFPNPLVLDFDDNLQKYAGKIHRVPFCSDEFMAKNYEAIRLKRLGSPHNRRDALKNWVREEGPKLQANQTLVLDSWTTVQDAFDQQTRLEPVISPKTGKEDEFAFWDRKIDYSTDLHIMLKSLRCNVVVTVHEVNKKDKKTGELLEEKAIFMQGKFVTKMSLYYSDWIYCLARNKLAPDGKPLFQDTAKTTPVVEYVWQVLSDSERKCKTRMSNAPMYVEPSFSVFEKYP